MNRDNLTGTLFQQRNLRYLQSKEKEKWTGAKCLYYYRREEPESSLLEPFNYPQVDQCFR